LRGGKRREEEEEREGGKGERRGKGREEKRERDLAPLEKKSWRPTGAISNRKSRMVYRTAPF